MAGTSDEVIAVGDADFHQQVVDAQLPVLVDFWATWCAPCRAIAPSVEALATQYKGKVKFTKLNVDENQDTAQQYGIRSLPTLLIFKGGKVVEQIVGAAPKKKIEDSISKAL